MGADIHVYLEAKNKEGKWEPVNLYNADGDPIDPYPYRSYSLFALLAGVRGWYDPLVPPRGLPEDISPEVVAAWELGDGDWHTPTYYDMTELHAYLQGLREFREVEEEEDGQSRFSCLTYFVNIIEFIFEVNHHYCYQPNKTRVILWFDN